MTTAERHMIQTMQGLFNVTSYSLIDMGFQILEHPAYLYQEKARQAHLLG